MVQNDPPTKPNTNVAHRFRGGLREFWLHHATMARSDWRTMDFMGYHIDCYDCTDCSAV